MISKISPHQNCHPQQVTMNGTPLMKEKRSYQRKNGVEKSSSDEVGRREVIPASRTSSSSPSTTSLRMEQGKSAVRATKEVARERILERMILEREGEVDNHEKLIVEDSGKTSTNLTSYLGRLPSTKIKPVLRSTFPSPITKQYLTLEEIQTFEGETKLEILCGDGRHYHVTLLHTGGSYVLHFPHWGKRHDIVVSEASVMEYCLTQRGKYSLGEDRPCCIHPEIEDFSTDIVHTKPPQHLLKKQRVSNDNEIVLPRQTKPNQRTSSLSSLSLKKSVSEVHCCDTTMDWDSRINRSASFDKEIGEGREFGSIPSQDFPIGWVGESIRLVCLNTNSVLTPAAKKYTELMKEFSAKELQIATHQRRNHEIDIEVDLLKSSLQSFEIPSFSSNGRCRWQGEAESHSDPKYLQHQSTKQMKMNRLLEEKIKRLEKVGDLRKQEMTISHQKDATLNYLTTNTMDLMRWQINEEIQNFLIERDDLHMRE